jgi:signal transduction histidine kinase
LAKALARAHDAQMEESRASSPEASVGTEVATHVAVARVLRRTSPNMSQETAGPQERYAAMRERLMLEHSNEWLKQRPRGFWRTTALQVVLSWASGLPPARLAIVATVHAMLHWHFYRMARSAEVRLSSRDEILRTSLLMMFGNAVTVVTTGGLTSPFLPSVFATVLICANAFGDGRETQTVLATFLGLLVVMGVLPESITGVAWPAEWYRIALVLALSHSLWLAAQKIVETTGVYVRAGAMAAAARDDLLLARSERVNALEGMAARVAHDLKNPLAAIQGLTELLERQATDPRTAERLHVVNDECARMGVTLRDYLAMSRPIEELVPVKQPLAPIVDRVLTLFEARAASNDVTLVRAEGDATAEVDAHRLEEALLNLVSNAIEASPRGAKIELLVRESGDRALVEVRDHGEGMSANVLARIGTPYFTTRKTGTGLGVALTRTIIKQHGGELSHESTQGRGTVARIALPHHCAAPLAEAS